MAAAGDGGLRDYPATSPNVIAVGGTNLSVYSDNGATSLFLLIRDRLERQRSEFGPSQYEPEPAYQEGVQSTGIRTAPDVSADSNNYTWIYDSTRAIACVLPSKRGDHAG